MNDKILIGSIIAVAVLIGISFTSVVGYNSVDSNVKASPLFTVRSSRVIDKESEDLTCDYIGKGKEITILLPERKDKIDLIRKTFERIRAIDDTTFNKFMNLVFNQIQKKHELKDLNIDEVKIALHQIRNNPEIIRMYHGNDNVYVTWIIDPWPTVCWFPGCLLYLIPMFLAYMFLYIVFIFYCPVVNTAGLP